MPQLITNIAIYLSAYLGGSIAVWEAVITIASIAGSYAANRAAMKKAMKSFADLGGRTVTTRDPIAARPVIYGQVRVGGTIVFASESGANNQYLNLVIALAGHEVEEIGDIYFGDELALTGPGSACSGRFAGYGDVFKKLGGDSQTVETNLQTEVGSGVWSNNHRLRGIAYIYVRLKHNPDLYASGIPNITAIVKGKKVYDPRSTLTAWSANSALCLRDYLTDTTYGLGMSASEIDDTEVTAAANVCDEAVALAAGGTESRYKTNGVFESSEASHSIIDNLAAAMAGSVFYVGGKWIIRAGAHQTPTLTFTEDDLRGAVSIQTRDSRRETCNAVRGTYISANNQWQPADFPPVVNATYLSEDGNERIWRDIVLGFTTSDTAAQRLAKIELERARQDITATLKMKLTALSCQCGDVIQLTLARYGWTNKQFEVIDSQFAIENDGNIGIDLTVRETASGVWTWSAEETAVDLAPNTDLPDPYTVPTPTGLALASGSGIANQQPDGTILDRLRVTWTLAARSFIQNGGFVWIEYKKTADPDWITWASVRGDQTVDYITDVKVGVQYDVRIRFENCWGVRGSYATVSAHTVLANGITPSNPTAATKTAEGINTATDGSVTAYLTFSVPALPSGAAKQFLLYKRSTDTDWLVAAGPLTNNSPASVTIVDLTPGVIYAVCTVALSSLDVASSYIAATSSPFTAPSKTAGPATPTGGALSGSGVVPKYYTGTGIYLFGCVVTWNKNTETDLSHYEVKVTVTDSDAAVDYNWTLYDGGSAGPLKVTDNRITVYNLLAAAGWVRVRAVNTSGVASAWASLGSAAGACNTGAGNAASKNVGTTAGTVAAGDDSRITGAAQKSSNLSDLANAATARSNLGLGSMATQNSTDVNVTDLQVGGGSSTTQLKVIYADTLVKSLTGGSPSEDFDISLTNRGFGAKPDVGLVQCYDSLYNCTYLYDDAGSTSTNARCRIESLDGSNIPAGNARFFCLFIDN